MKCSQKTDNKCFRIKTILIKGRWINQEMLINAKFSIIMSVLRELRLSKIPSNHSSKSSKGISRWNKQVTIRVRRAKLNSK